MDHQSLRDIDAWQKLNQHAAEINRPENHLKYLIKDPDRIHQFSRKGGGILYDFSRQRVNANTMDTLFQLADKRNVKNKFNAMINGEIINKTENRAALHTATRNLSDRPIHINGKNVMPEISEQRDRIKTFADDVRSKRIIGSTGKPFKHIVVIGIGGSYLGTAFVSEALYAYSDAQLSIHYVSNVDIDNIGRAITEIDLETTLWIVISKSYTTAETLANTHQAYMVMKKNGLDPSKHVVTVTGKGSPGDNPTNPVLQSFYMFDFIGGRYSVTSAVGGVPLSLFLGYDMFERFLKGAQEMDQHAADAPISENLPLISALISVWNNNLLGYPAQGIIPYASALAKLAPHIQQLNMESNGKSVDTVGKFTEESTGMIIFGEPGTNAQHSFFQLAHQGRPFPIDFIGMIRPQYEQYKAKSKGVTNHQELWANLISQPTTLAQGKDDGDPSKFFSGNRPSSSIIVSELSPENIGRLLSFYEAKTVYEAFIWGINPFDQFGVELGKTMASDIRNEIVQKNIDLTHDFKHLDSISKFYLDTLFSGHS